MTHRKNTVSTLLTVVGVLFVIVVALSMLMPVLSSAKRDAIIQSIESYEPRTRAPKGLPAAGDVAHRTTTPPRPAIPRVPRAVVKSFKADIDLLPRLSVGTAMPQSIYVANVKAAMEARGPAGGGACRIEMPLPPQVISVANVRVTVNGDASDTFALEHKQLVWTGQLPAEENANLEVTYSATGNGIFTLEKPSDGVIDTYHVRLVAHRSNIRMLQLSLQPQDPTYDGDKTIYVWDYPRLLLAQPISVDVLGIAAIDRLGELTWLGPVSVLAFGFLISLAALALDPEKLGLWMLVMIVGCFAGAYPLMYFMQDFMSLTVAVMLAGAAVVAVIGWRVISLFGVRTGIAAGVLLPGAIMALTVLTTLTQRTAVQGALLTVEALLVLVVAMLALPKAQKNLRARAEAATPPLPEPGTEALAC